MNSNLEEVIKGVETEIMPIYKEAFRCVKDPEIEMATWARYYQNKYNVTSENVKYEGRFLSKNASDEEIKLFFETNEQRLTIEGSERWNELAKEIKEEKSKLNVNGLTPIERAKEFASLNYLLAFKQFKFSPKTVEIDINTPKPILEKKAAEPKPTSKNEQNLDLDLEAKACMLMLELLELEMTMQFEFN